jgi:ribosome maturation factor RimP
LKLPRQFIKNVGRTLDVVTLNDEKYSGVLVSAGDQGIVLETRTKIKKQKTEELKQVPLNFSDIKTAKEVITFKQ